jgi:hypothetical protein
MPSSSGFCSRRRLTRLKSAMARSGCSSRDLICEDRPRAKGMCNKHYRRVRGHGHPGRLLRETRIGQICAIDGCDRVLRSADGGARGMCGMHYQRWWTHGDPLRVMLCGWENRNTPTASTSPTLRDIAWAAGFMEGEGSFTVRNVSAPQKETEPLTKLVKWFGGRISRNAKGIYTWRISGARARGVALTLYPLLSKRRQQQIQIFLNEGPKQRAA